MDCSNYISSGQVCRLLRVGWLNQDVSFSPWCMNNSKIQTNESFRLLTVLFLVKIDTPQLQFSNLSISTICIMSTMKIYVPDTIWYQRFSLIITYAVLPIITKRLKAKKHEEVIHCLHLTSPVQHQGKMPSNNNRFT